MASAASASPAGYSPADRLLHRLALGWRPVIETSFDLESAAFGRAAAALDLGRPIFVCGLARAGTSLVTRLVAVTPGIATPTYRDMPFPLAPNLWARLSGKRRRVTASERGHGDGVSHDLDTPEAVEEVFWRCFEASAYRQRDGLAPTPPDAETMARFRRYVALVALRGRGSRYLSKNNNNVVRLGALAKAFPDARFVHPFRHPLAQARSLQGQHERACALQRSDRFRLRYAQWLGHHEFGLDRRPLPLAGTPATGEESEGLGYWLSSWRSVYRHLLDQPGSVRERQIFLDYDALCRAPGAVLGALARFLDLDAVDGTDVRPAKADCGRSAEALPPEVEDVHRALLERSGRRQRCPSPASGPPLGQRA